MTDHSHRFPKDQPLTGKALKEWQKAMDCRVPEAISVLGIVSPTRWAQLVKNDEVLDAPIAALIRYYAANPQHFPFKASVDPQGICSKLGLRNIVELGDISGRQPISAMQWEGATPPQPPVTRLWQVLEEMPQHQARDFVSNVVLESNRMQQQAKRDRAMAKKAESTAEAPAEESAEKPAQKEDSKAKTPKKGKGQEASKA